MSGGSPRRGVGDDEHESMPQGGATPGNPRSWLTWYAAAGFSCLSPSPLLGLNWVRGEEVGNPDRG